MDRVGRYQLHEKLGEGGMGVVYKGYDPFLQRTVAVKLIAGNLDDDPSLRERFFKEARAAGHLSHRNLVTIHDLGEEQGQPFFAMEYLEGRDLGRRMRSQEPMTLARKLDIVAQVGEGLRYAHAQGVTHRDIKPANIFLTSSGEVKLLDFGLARLHGSELTRSRSMLGTIAYMAPEQVRGDPADARTDLFALGVVLYELLSGRRAFDGDSFATTLHRILEGTPEPLARLDPCLPQELIQIVDRALAKAPEDRYQRVDDFLVDLAAFRATLRGSEPSCLGREAEPKTQAPGSGSGAAQVVTAMPRTPVPAAPPASGSTVPPAAPPGRRLPLRSFGALALLAALGVAGWQLLPRDRPEAPRRGAPPPTSGSAASAVPPGTPEATAAPPDAGTREPRAAKGTAGQAPASSRTKTRAKQDGPAPPARAAAAPPRPEAAAPSRESASRDAAREAAQASLVELALRRGRAESARAQELAATSFETAVNAEQAARRRLQAGAYTEAATGLAEAGRLFERAEIEARAEGARLAEREQQSKDRLNASRRRYQEARGRAIEAGAEAAAHGLMQQAAGHAAEGESLLAGGDPDGAARAFEAGTASLEEAARRAAAARPAAEAPPERGQPEADGRAAAERAVAEALDRYASALESRTVSRLRLVWPTLSGAQERAIEEEFRNSRSISVALSEPRIELSGNRATVTCQRSYRLETRDGQRLQTDTTTVLALRRDGESWVIEDVRHQPRR